MRISNETVLGDKTLLAWWANNAGRGSNNCTLCVVPTGTPRAERSDKQTDVIACVRTSSWAGNVNLSKRVQDALGIEL